MLLGAGEVLKHCAIGPVLDYPQVHLDGIIHNDARFGGTLGQDLLY